MTNWIIYAECTATVRDGNYIESCVVGLDPVLVTAKNESDARWRYFRDHWQPGTKIIKVEEDI
jgi:hypothetical protein